MQGDLQRRRRHRRAPQPAERPVTPTFAELDAVAESLARVDFRQATRCDEWTVHDLTAHLAGGADEIARHLQALVDGQAIPETRPLAEREDPLRELSSAALYATLESNASRLKDLLL